MAYLPGDWAVVARAESGVLAEIVQALEDHGARTRTIILHDGAVPAIGGCDGVISLLGPADTARLTQVADARIWAVTQNAVAAERGDAAPDVEQAQVWGLGRVAALEAAGPVGRSRSTCRRTRATATSSSSARC